MSASEVLFNICKERAVCPVASGDVLVCPLVHAEDPGEIAVCIEDHDDCQLATVKADS